MLYLLKPGLLYIHWKSILWETSDESCFFLQHTVRDYVRCLYVSLLVSTVIFSSEQTPQISVKKILQSCTKHQIQIKIWFTSIFVFIIILFFKFECHWTQNANLKKAIWMIIAIHYYYLRLMSGGFCNQHPLSIYISRLSFTHINAINLWSMKTLPQGGDGAKVKLETHYRVFSNINIQTAPDNSGALRDHQTIIYTE